MTARGEFRKCPTCDRVIFYHEGGDNVNATCPSCTRDLLIELGAPVMESVQVEPKR